MGYSISGVFTEACDCTLICPCWLDDTPDEEHCTGLFAWQLGPNATIDGAGVGSLQVVSVSTHSGRRKGGGVSTALFIDEAADERQFALLGDAFSGGLAGPLQDLAAVSGAVLQRARARIEITADGAGWHIYVGRAAEPRTDGAGLIEVTGAPSVFEGEDEPLTIAHTALEKELSVVGPGEVVAHRTESLAVRVPVLPGAYLDVRGRSAMRGRFHYAHSARRAVPAGARE